MKADPSQISKPGNSLKEALIGLIRESEKNPSPRGRG
jgi:hypothetical protein